MEPSPSAFSVNKGSSRKEQRQGRTLLASPIKLELALASPSFLAFTFNYGMTFILLPVIGYIAECC